MNQEPYPLTFSVDYPDRDLNRLSTFFRIFAAIPIIIVLHSMSGFGGWNYGDDYSSYGAGGIAGALLFLPPLLMILFREKYPLWWQGWNRELLRFQNRVWIYISLMDDRYPSTDAQQSVHLDFVDVDAERDLNRWLPLVKWFLAIPHYIVLVILYIGVFFALVFAWFAILFTSRYPRGIFDFIQSVYRWQNRVVAYALILITDKYPPFGFD